MRVVVVMPRALRFSPRGATSIDLCVRDLVAFSRFRETTTILGEPLHDPFEGFDYRGVPRPRFDNPALHAVRLARAIRALQPDVVLVQQHVGIAYLIARLVKPVPVLLHRHGIGRGFGNPARRWRYRPAFGALAHTVLVSGMVRETFLAAFADLAPRSSTLANGIDLSLWRPAAKDKLIAYVGRAMEEKGVLPLAEALARVLPRRPDWRASLTLVATAADAPVVAALRRILEPVWGQVDWAENRPIDDVRATLQRAAVAVVPSIVREGFPRAAVEAHAAGAALISSGSGGLREVSADAALYLDAVTPNAIATALHGLIDDPERCCLWQERSRRRAETALDIRVIAGQLDGLYVTHARKRS